MVDCLAINARGNKAFQHTIVLLPEVMFHSWHPEGESKMDMCGAFVRLTQAVDHRELASQIPLMLHRTLSALFR